MPADGLSRAQALHNRSTPTSILQSSKNENIQFKSIRLHGGETAKVDFAFKTGRFDV
jgi:hypothetical protein